MLACLTSVRVYWKQHFNRKSDMTKLSSAPRSGRRFAGFALAAVSLLMTAVSLRAAAPLELKNGDRVVLIGDTLIEREQLFGYVEERLTVQYPDRNVIFRNLGWSADTPAGASRASFDFDKAGVGFAHIKEQISTIQPTLVIVGYGMASSFQGAAGLPEFKQQMNALVDMIQTTCTNKSVRFVFLSPVRHENLGAPLPDPAPHNAQLALYTQAVQGLAAEHKGTFVSLYDNLLGDGTKTHPPRAFTDNGIHPNAFGYLRISEAIEKSLIWEPNLWRLAITAQGEASTGSRGTIVNQVERQGDQIKFTTLDTQLVPPALLEKGTRVSTANAPSLLEIDGLSSGTYKLEEDGILIATATAKEWAAGVAIESGAQFEQAEQLRQAILRKNNLFFDRWRPQNETYLFGFRKHEQGQNAKEIPMFDPLIAEQEAKIARLRRPVPHEFVLTKLAVRGLKPITNAPHQDKPAADPALPQPLPLPNFEVADGFEISLYAENPLLAKPIQMNFDPQGRLWVVSSAVYPQIEPGKEANDKVIVLEDTKGVGKADKSTVFVEGLMTPTGVEPGDGGVYVAQSTQLLHFKDTDGDGKADQKRVVLSGFGTEDTHHILHTLHWGHDGQLYFDQSIYIHSHIETPNGVERLNSGGVWHLRPPTMELGVYLKGFCNPWGHQFDTFGQSFMTDGAGYQGISFGIPGATYFTYAIMRRELQSISAGSYPKFCALELINSEQFPPDWQGNAITCDFRAHRVVRFEINEKDGGYVSHEMPDLVRSTNVTFRPIDVKLGPDGALYIADWSNPIIQHGEVDFRDPRRDHEHGRIWRVSAKNRPLVKPPQLVGAPNKVLFNELKSPNRYEQQQAKRVLTERGKSILKDLERWTREQKDEAGRLQALWMYQAIDVVEPALLDKVLTARDGRIRAAATRVISYWHPRLKNAQELLAKGVADEFPRVRIEAVRALAEIPNARSAELVLCALNLPMDSFLDYAVWLSINDLAKTWVEAVKTGAWKPEGREKQLEFAMKALEPGLAAELVGESLASRPISRDGTGPWIEIISQSGDAKALSRLYQQVLTNGFDEAAAVRALNALGDAARLRNQKPTGDLASVGTLFKHDSERLRRAAVELAGKWKSASLLPDLIGLAKGPEAKPDLIKAACTSVREIGGSAAITELTKLTTAENRPEIRRGAVTALASLDLERAKQPAIELLNGTTDDNQALELWRSLLEIKGAAKALTRALPRSGLSPVMARAGVRAAGEGGRNEPDLLFALERGADLEGEGQSLSDAEIKSLVEKVMKEGDAARGQILFRRKDTSCTLCHAIGGAGGKVGPDMTSIGASAQPDYLIESILYPNRKIKEGYHSIQVETADGDDISGILVRENNNQLVLRNSQDVEVSIAKDNIKSRKLGNSLMPSGLVDALTGAERLDLYRFLIELGKPGPYDASKGNVARVWRLYPQPLEDAQFGDDKILKTPLTNGKWAKTLSLVDGNLPKQELQDALKRVADRAPKAIYAAAQVQVASAGAFHFKVPGIPSTSVWIDGKNVGNEPLADLTPGIHTIIIKLDSAKLPETLRLESNEGTFVQN